MQYLPSQPLSIKQVIVCSYRVFTDLFRPMLGMLTLFFVLVATPFIIMAVQQMHCPIPVEAMLNNANNPWLSNVALNVYFIMVLWISAAYYLQLNALMHAAPISLQTALLKALKRLPFLIIAIFIAVLLNLLGYVFLLLPGIYLAIVFWLYCPLLIIDELGPIAALKEALHLVWQNWWRTAAILGISLLIMLGMIVLFGLLILLAAIFLHPLSITMNIIHSYLQIILACLLFPIAATLKIVQIHNLKLYKTSAASSSTEASQL